MNDTNPSDLTAADRDELALLALKRMKGFERRVLALMYGLAGVTEEADGTCHAVKVIASLCRCSEKRVAKIQQEALGKLAAVLDLEPVQAGRHLFRMGTHWARNLPHASNLNPQPSHDLPPQNAGNGILAADAALEGPGGFPDE